MRYVERAGPGRHEESLKPPAHFAQAPRPIDQVGRGIVGQDLQRGRPLETALGETCPDRFEINDAGTDRIVSPLPRRAVGGVEDTEPAAEEPQALNRILADRE